MAIKASPNDRWRHCMKHVPDQVCGGVVVRCLSQPAGYACTNVLRHGSSDPAGMCDLHAEIFSDTVPVTLGMLLADGFGGLRSQHSGRDSLLGMSAMLGECSGTYSCPLSLVLGVGGGGLLSSYHHMPVVSDELLT